MNVAKTSERSRRMLIRIPALLTACLTSCGCMLFSPSPGRAQATPQVIEVKEGERLQPILDRAQPGDTIVLPAGAQFSGNFVMRRKRGDGVITIRSNAADQLPPEGVRLNPERDRGFLARIVTPNVLAAINFEAGASNYVFRGIEVTIAAGIYSSDLVILGTGRETAAADIPENVVFQHVWIHGDAQAGGKRGIRANCRRFSLLDSYISDIKATGQETHAVNAWAGSQFVIRNNYLEAAGINVFFGGLSAGSPELIPTDIVVEGNHLMKPLSWQGTWVVKNHFELKTGINVRFRFNILENSWVSGQTGYSINMKCTTCDASNYPWNVVRNVVISHNVIRNVLGAVVITGLDITRSTCSQEGPGKVTAWDVNVLGSDTDFEKLEPGWQVIVGKETRTVVRVYAPGHLVVDKPFANDVPEPASYRFLQPIAGYLGDVLVSDNAIWVKSAPNQTGRVLLIANQADAIKFRNNTAIHEGFAIVADLLPNPGFEFRGNIFTNDSNMGIKGSGVAEGTPTFTRYFPGADVGDNIIVQAAARPNYPPGNSYPRSIGEIGFAQFDSDLRLASGSSFLGKTASGRDPGADMNVIQAVTSAVSRGEFRSESFPQ